MFSLMFVSFQWRLSEPHFQVPRAPFNPRVHDVETLEEGWAMRQPDPVAIQCCATRERLTEQVGLLREA